LENRLKNYSPERRIGLAFPGQPYSLRQVIAAAKKAEVYGFESIWIAEDLWTGRDAVTPVACLASATDRIQIGTAVVNPYTRHPVLTAMTVNTLRELAGGRLRLGIGSGLPWKSLVEEQMAAKPPLRAMREAVDTMRALLSGGCARCGQETVSFRVHRKCFAGALEPTDYYWAPAHLREKSRPGLPT
jgi:5,10-methylenetetrahydromethanopterin reductase